MKKRCIHCKQEKEPSEFRKFKYSNDGLFSICKECQGDSSKKRCITCKQVKPVSEFYRAKRQDPHDRTDGLQLECKECFEAKFEKYPRKKKKV